MNNIEEIKLKMARLFQTVSYEVNNFLDYTLASLGIHYGFETQPIRIFVEGLNLVFVIDRKVDDETGARYHQVSCLENKFPSADTFVLRPGESHTLADSKKRFVSFRDGIFTFESRETSFMIDESYSEVPLPHKTHFGLSFDVVNKKMVSLTEIPVEEAIMKINRGLDLVAFMQDVRDAWALSKEYGMRDADFSKCIMESGAHELMSDYRKTQATVFTEILYTYITNPSVKHLVAEDALVTNYISSFSYDNHHQGIFPERIKKHFFQKDNALEVMGVDERWASIIDIDDTPMRSYRVFNNVMTTLDRVFKLDTQERARRAARLCSLKLTYHSGNHIGLLLYLGSHGYDIDKLYDYLEDVDTSQALAMDESLSVLYQWIRMSHALTGEYPTEFPSYLRVGHDIGLREIQKAVNEYKQGFGREDVVSRILYSRPELTGVYGGIEVIETKDTSVSALDRLSFDLFKLGGESLDVNALIPLKTISGKRSKKNPREFRMFIYGNTVTGGSAAMMPAYRRDIMLFCKENNLIYPQADPIFENDYQ